jgi:SiaC family regulatory phosphoprotein/Family of unknown function (DUF6272)
MKPFLEYKGPVTYRIIDQILKDLKKSDGYRSLHKTTAKRVYAILVELLENIEKHSLCKSYKSLNTPCSISSEESGDKIIVRAGNPVSQEKKSILEAQLDLINNLDQVSLVSLYEDKINRKTKKYTNNAGLGFLLVRLKSGNKIDFSFTEVKENVWYFRVNIQINKYIMRKLLIDKTSSSPRVLLDPEKNVFEISGESRPADVSAFYNEILTWYDDYALFLSKVYEEKSPPVFDFDFDYFNSSSAKYILDFCKMIAATRAKGLEIKINWHYEKDDMDMLESGREMSRISRLPFEFVQKDIK